MPFNDAFVSKAVLIAKRETAINFLLRARKPCADIVGLAEGLVRALLLDEPSHPTLEFWDKSKDETILEFVARVHGDRINSREFSQADFKQLDFNGYQAFINFCSYRKILPSSIIPAKTALYPKDQENIRISETDPSPLQRRRAKERIYRQRREKTSGSHERD